MTDIGELTTRLMEITAWQRTPVALYPADYAKMIMYGIKDLYIMTGRALGFTADKFSGDGNVFPTQFEDTLEIDEEEYVLVCAQIEFYQRVQADVNNIVGYTTDGLSITNADKPYVHLQQSIDDLRTRKAMLLYKMPRYMQL